MKKFLDLDKIRLSYLETELQKEQAGVMTNLGGCSHKFLVLEMEDLKERISCYESDIESLEEEKFEENECEISDEQTKLEDICLDIEKDIRYVRYFIKSLRNKRKEIKNLKLKIRMHMEKTYELDDLLDMSFDIFGCTNEKALKLKLEDLEGAIEGIINKMEDLEKDKFIDKDKERIMRISKAL